MNLEILAAVCFMPLMMLFAAQGWTWIVLSFISLSLFLSYIYSKFLRMKIRTRFFLAWSVTSFFFVLGVFEFEVVPYLEILFVENLALMCFVSVMCICIYMVKSNCYSSSYSNQPNGSGLLKLDQGKKTRCDVCSILQPPRADHCDICGYCVYKRDHHSMWLDTCIGAGNHRYFIATLIAMLLCCLYSSNLTLTTICHPTLVGGLILMPDDCSDVYGDIHIAICFVSAIYTLMISVLISLVLLQQLWLVCYNTTYQEWKQGQLGLYSKGMFRNCFDFCCNRP